MADTIKVKAVKQGYAPLAPGQTSQLIEKGTVFVVSADSKLGSWMVPVGEVAAPVKEIEVAAPAEEKPEKPVKVDTGKDKPKKASKKK